jgi:hypothetical protein
MNMISKTLWVGILALALCETASAHDGYGSGGYRDSGWAGSVTVYGSSSGYSGYNGSLSYGAGYVYAPVVAAPVYRHGPQCYHGKGHGHPRHYKRGHGRSHGNAHGHHQRRGRH